MRRSEAFQICDCIRLAKAPALLFLLLVLSFVHTSSHAQLRQALSAEQMVNQMLQAENAAREMRQHFLYRREERSLRTKGQLWNEVVVETTDGRMHRLLTVNGKPLSGGEAKAEDSRITYLANHPADFRREAQARRDDELRLSNLLKEVPRLFLLKFAGSDRGCTRASFAPNPQLQEVSYQDRAVHAMSGMLLIHTTD